MYSLPRREQVATLEQNLEQGWVKLETRAGQKGTCHDALARSRPNVERRIAFQMFKGACEAHITAFWVSLECHAPRL